MPIRSRRRRVRRSRRRRPTVVKIARQVRAITRGREKKWFNAEISNVAIPVAGTITSLSSIPQGDTSLTRDGNQVSAKRFSVKCSILPDFADSMTTVRVVFFRWTSTSAPVAFMSSNSTTGILDDSQHTASDQWAPLNQTALQAGYLKPIKDILYNYISSTSAATPVLTPSVPRTFVFSRRYKDLPMKYPSSSTGQANINNFFVLMTSTEATAPPVMYLQSQLVYHDS